MVWIDVFYNGERTSKSSETAQSKGAEGVAAAAEGDKPAADGAKGDKKEGDDKKPVEEKK